MKRVVTATDYTVGDGDLFLSIRIGDGQIGGSAVMLVEQNKVIFKGETVDRLRLGTGSDLKNTSVWAKTTVADINDRTNRTSVTYVLVGGPAPMSTEVTSSVDADGDSMVFSASFRMVGS